MVNLESSFCLKESASTMEGNGEISDTDSGIILHSSGSDSPTATTKDLTTHTRAMRLKHQSLQDRLQLCVLELKKLCIREAELTGELSADYPLLPGETPPKVRRRIGAAFQLDEQSIPRGPEESPLNLVDAELALQLKIYEAARKLCREEHLSKAVRRSRVQQCKREEKRVKELQESAFQLRLQHGRSSPLPAFTVPLQECGNSDDSSLSDSPVLDEEVIHPQPSSGPPCREQHHLPQTFPVSLCPNSSILSSSMASPPHTPIKRTPSQLTPSHLTPIRRTLSHHTPIKRTPSQLTPSQLTPSPFTPSPFTPRPFTPSQLTPSQLTPREQGSPSLDSMLSFNSDLEYEAPPIQHSPWTESSLDQPFQKTKKSRSSTKSTASSPASSQVLPPLEACLGNAGLARQLSQLKLSDGMSNSTPSTPEMRLHRNLSLRISNPETPLEAEKSRGRPRSARRRLTDYTVTIPETPVVHPAGNYGNQANSEDSNSEHSSTSRTSSICQEQQCEFPNARQYQHPSPTGRLGPPALQSPGFYQNSRYQSSPSFNRGHYSADVVYALDLDMARGYRALQAPSNRRDYMYAEAPGPPTTAPRRAPPQEVRLSRSPSLWEPQRCRSNALPRQVVNDQLKSWHQRNQFRGPRPRSLDRQGAVRVKNVPDWVSPLAQSQRYQEQVMKKLVIQRTAEDGPGPWFGDDSAKIVSQV